jgi:hypothetical protein
MNDYQIHYEKEERIYWIGRLVRYPSGQVAFVQQVGNNTPYKNVAERWLRDIAKQYKALNS